MDKFYDITAIIFDLGDTLVTHTIDEASREEDASKEVQDLLSREGYSISEVFYRQLKMEMWRNWKEDFARSGQEFELELFLNHLLCRLGLKQEEAARLVPSITNIIYQSDLKSLVLKPTVKETLTKLEDTSFKLGMISNSSYSYDHIVEILNRVTIAHYFDSVLVSSREKIRKPNPVIFEKALQSLGASANSAVFVGDDPQVDIQGAKSVGMKTILLADRKTEAKRLNDSDTKTVEQVAEILGHIEK